MRQSTADTGTITSSSLRTDDLGEAMAAISMEGTVTKLPRVLWCDNHRSAPPMLGSIWQHCTLQWGSQQSTRFNNNNYNNQQ